MLSTEINAATKIINGNGFDLQDKAVLTELSCDKTKVQDNFEKLNEIAYPIVNEYFTTEDDNRGLKIVNLDNHAHLAVISTVTLCTKLQAKHEMVKIACFLNDLNEVFKEEFGRDLCTKETIIKTVNKFYAFHNFKVISL